MNFDGREVAKAHVQRLDLEVLLKVSCRRERGKRERGGEGREEEENEVGEWREGGGGGGGDGGVEQGRRRG